MADISHRGEPMTAHPDVHEMRARYDRMLSRRDVAMIDAPIFLLGLYCIISPWVVGFSATQADVATHNLIVGIAVGLLALGFTVTPERMYGMSWALCAVGIWLAISPWVLITDPPMSLAWNNIIVGALAFLLGLMAAWQVRNFRAETGAET
ncbi:SPW repeat protein [Glycomyces sp. YM15]|uniref:SPW repeat protein n=1 Tax=Glycomyces sp. YM15 TaxID=2800446 RepID=UPI001962D502|nr:SPW repeat protein [Glycomyces sp. YM15]